MSSKFRLNTSLFKIIYTPRYSLYFLGLIIIAIRPAEALRYTCVAPSVYIMQAVQGIRAPEDTLSTVPGGKCLKRSIRGWYRRATYRGGSREVRLRVGKMKYFQRRCGANGNVFRDGNSIAVNENESRIIVTAAGCGSSSGPGGNPAPTATPTHTPTPCSGGSGSFIAKFTSNSDAQNAISQLGAVHQITGYELMYPIPFWHGASTLAVDRQYVVYDGNCLDQTIAAFRADSRVEGVVFNQIITLDDDGAGGSPGGAGAVEGGAPVVASALACPPPPAGSPNDVEFDCQWNLLGDSEPQPELRTHALEAWNNYHKGGERTVIVAVVDTGVSVSGPIDSVLSNEFHDKYGKVRVIDGLNFGVTGGPADTSDACASTSSGHGTGVAGIIGARTNNSHGVAGINPGVEIFPIKITPVSGSPGCRATDLKTLARGIAYAADMGADIINISFSFPLVAYNALSQIERSMIDSSIDFADSLGKVIVASARTDNGLADPGTDIGWPASDMRVIAVNGMTSGGSNVTNPTRFLGYSPAIDPQRTYVSAPAGVTTLATDSDGIGPLAGTSSAAAHVSGLAALIKSYRPCATHTQIKEIIKTATFDLAGLYHQAPADYELYGRGLVRFDWAMACASTGQYYGYDQASYINDGYLVQSAQPTTCLATGPIPQTCISPISPTHNGNDFNVPRALASNKKGEVVGYDFNLNEGEVPKGFYWRKESAGGVSNSLTPGFPIPVNPSAPPIEFITPTDINDMGNFVVQYGWSAPVGCIPNTNCSIEQHAHIMNAQPAYGVGGWSYNINVLGEIPVVGSWPAVDARSINNANIVVGNQGSWENSLAFLYDHQCGGGQCLFDLRNFLPPTHGSFAYEVGEQNLVVGEADLDISTAWNYQPFILNYSNTSPDIEAQIAPITQGGQGLILASPSGYIYAGASKINNSPRMDDLVVVGIGASGTPNIYSYQPIVWEWNGTSLAPHVLNRMQPQIACEYAPMIGDINDKGQLVGVDQCADTDGLGWKPVLWQRDSGGVWQQPQDLNSLLTPTDAQHWVLDEVTNIDDRGRVVGSGDYRASPTAPWDYKAYYMQLPITNSSSW